MEAGDGGNRTMDDDHDHDDDDDSADPNGWTNDPNGRSGGAALPAGRSGL
jgi:hypothetical protein